MDKNCFICGAAFHVKPSHFNTRVCCSKKCQSEHFKESLKGHKNPNYKGITNSVKNCKICGEQFIIKHFKNRNTKTCSLKCSHKLTGLGHKGKIIGKDVVLRMLASRAITYKRKGVVRRSVRLKCVCGNKKDPEAKTCLNCFHERIKRIKICVICESTFNPKNIIIKTCSRRCSTLLKSKNSSNERNPNWKGGLRGKNQRQRNHFSYKDWRKLVFERDKYTCIDCGKIGGQIHSHHIKSFSKHPELRTDVSNGKTLCVECHNKYHPSLNLAKLLSNDTKKWNKKRGKHYSIS